MGYKDEGVYFSENSILITDNCEENTITIFKSEQNSINISTIYDFGIDGLSITLNKQEVYKLIKFLQYTL